MAKPGWYNDNVNRTYPLVRETALAEGVEDALLADIGFVIGANADFDYTTDQFLIDEIAVSGTVGVVRITCGSIGTAVFGPIDLTGDDYQTIFITVGGSPDICTPAEPLVEAFLVVGKIAAWLEKFPSDNSFTYTAVQVEPARIQNLSQSYVTSISIANNDRTRVTIPSGCNPITWPFPINVVHNVQQCVVGSVAFTAGYNAIVRQDVQTNQITIGAEVGAGLGEPCTQVELFDGEAEQLQGLIVQNAQAITTLDGALRCGEVVRSINGSGGRLLDFLSRKGALITPVPEENTIIVDVNNSQLAICIPGEDVSELPSEVSEIVP